VRHHSAPGPRVSVEAVASGDFRAALSCWASGVSIFTAPGPVGLTVSSFSSLSLEPPLILGCIAKSTGAHDALVAAPTFAVHLLASDQRDLSKRFAGPIEERFADLDYAAGSDNVPLLSGALARLVCRQESVTEGGDHTILVGRVVEVESSQGEPLVYYSRDYRRIDYPG
jgi:flavin reductase (DIM6/NTAB) family NADH-FMN oxidoreductase RutF